MKQLLYKSILLLTLLVFANNSFAQNYKAIASGIYSAASTWENGNIPPDSIKFGSLLVPSGFTVNLDKHVYVGQSVGFTINGTLNGNSSLFLHEPQFNMGANGVIQVDSIFVDVSGSSILYVNNNFEPNKLTLRSGAIRPLSSGGNIPIQNLYMENGNFSIQIDMTIKPNGHIYLRNADLPFQTGFTFTLNNTYDVTYEQQAHSTGIEATGSGLRNLTVNVGFGNELLASDTHIKNGTLTIYEGDYNLSGGKLEISGDGQIDFAGTGVLKSTLTSEIIIDKPGKTLNSQLLFKAGANSFKNLSINTAGEVKLGSDVKVTGTLDLQGGKLNLQGNKLNLLAGGMIRNASSSNYIIADGGGQLVNDIAPNTSVTFPIGTAANYAPCIVTSKNNTPYNSFSAAVVGDVKNRGTMGNSIAGTQPLVNATWLFDHNPPNNIALDVELMWSAGMEVNNFDRGNCYISQLAGATWDSQNPKTATETNGMYSIKREGMTHLSALAVFDGNTVDVTTITKVEQIKIYPNPATNVLHVDVTEQTEAVIYSTAGQLLIQQKLSANNSLINVANLSSGIYLLQLKTPNNQHTVRFSK